MSGDRFRVRIGESATDDLRRIGKKFGKKTYEIIRDLILDLAFEPKKKGEPLRGKLRGLHSLHYSRFRIIYRVQNDALMVLVVAAGWHESDSRKDVYALIEKALEAGMIDLPDSKNADRPKKSEG